MPLSFDEFYLFAEKATASASSLVFENIDRVDAKYKSDKTIVTETDFCIENQIRNLIRESYPNHNIVGEEYDDFNNGSDYTWTVDPIDGTLSYAHGVPLFGLLLGLCFKDFPLYGSMRLPMVRNNFLAGDSSVCLLNGDQVQTKKFTGWSNSLVLTTDFERIQNSKYSEIYQRLITKGSTSRTWGDCFGYYLLCSGRADLMMDLSLKDCDITPLVPILIGAGAKIIKLDGSYNNIVACVPELENTILESLN
mgnify:FL=1